MKAIRTFLAVAAAATLAVAGTYPVIVSDWFKQTFAGLAAGSDFTGAEGGATGGKWQTFSAGIAKVSSYAGRKCIDVDTFKKDDAVICFDATATTPSIARYDFAVNATPVPWLPSAQDGEVGALVLLANEGGRKTFAGYANGKWNWLYGHGMVQHSEEWLDCRAEFDYSASATAYVTYYVRNASGEYQPLADSTGASRFRIGSAKPKSIAFSGRGPIGDFAGYGISADTTRVNTWKGGASGDWDVPDNWTLGKVPGDGDMAVVNNSATISRTVGGQTYTIVTSGSGTELTFADGKTLRVGAGDVTLDGDFTAWGTIIVDPDATLRARGTFYGIEMGCGSTLMLLDLNALTVTTEPLHLEGVKLDVQSTDPSSESEGVLAAVGPYGSGGVPSLLNAGSWSAAWHGRLDGRSALWLVNDNYATAHRKYLAIWRDGVSGNLTTAANWGDVKPGTNIAARIGYGQAHVSNWDKFAFMRHFSIGATAGRTGEVDMSDGTITGDATAGGAVVVGTAGAGVLDIVGGAVRPCDYLWNYALTLGSGADATGTVKVRGGYLGTKDGGVSVGAAGTARMEICEGLAEVGGPLAVGYAGTLDVTGGALEVGGEVYVGRSTRDEAYDVAMTVSGGAVSNVAEGAFWVGSYGGLGSRAALTVSGGEVWSANPLVCGGYRSARVDVTGGRLVAPEIRVGYALIDAGDYAAFNLAAGSVETAGFTSGTSGERTVSLGDGQVVATAANADFFKGVEVVRLEGRTAFDNAADVSVSSALYGRGGFAKTGAGRFTAGGYAAWAGKTAVASGILDMDGGMVMGELEVASDASIVNAKYDDLDVLKFTPTPWTSGTVSTSPYLRVFSTITAADGNVAQILDGEGVVKGAVGFAADGSGLTFTGWTALGWTGMRFADGTPVAAGAAYEVQMLFDFTDKKHYVVYYVKRGEQYERLVSEDELTVLPVAGELASAKTFAGTGATMTRGEQLALDSGEIYYWIGGIAGAWNDGSSWSHVRGGPAAGAYPKSGDTAVVETPATVSVSDSAAGVLVVNANITVAGGALTLGTRASGVGSLALSGAELKGAADVAVPVVIAAKTENALGAGLTLTGALKGDGAVRSAASLCGDASAFSGAGTFAGGGIASAAAADNAQAAWTISDGAFPFAVGGITYEFGSLGGAIAPGAGSPDDVTLAVGARNEDCALSGDWKADSRSAVEWKAADASLAYSVANTALLRLTGGGRVVLGAAAGVPSAVTFADRGGVVSFAVGADADLSASFRDSTTAIAFDDGGTDRTWASAIGASNVGGLTKRGAGTLTLAAVPAYSGATAVEEGTLVVPAGTQLESLAVGANAKVVLDMAGATSSFSGIAFSAGSANRELTAQYFSVINCSVDYKVEVNDRNGIVLFVGSKTFDWVGREGGTWSATSNWRINGAAVSRLPAEQDDVCFPAAASVTLDRSAKVRNVVGGGDLTLKGSNTIEVVSKFSLDGGHLDLAGNVALAATEVSIGSLSGTGSVDVVTGTLAVSPDAERSDRFVGTLGVTNFVKRGLGGFAFEPLAPLSGTVAVEEAVLTLDCVGDMTNQPAAFVTMKQAGVLDLCGKTVCVAGFTGAGYVQNGVLETYDGVVTQSGGWLTMRAVDGTTYVASRAGETLRLEGAAGLNVRIVIPRDWFVAGVSAHNAVFCESEDIIWEIQRPNAYRPVYEGNGWWSIPGSGFTVRLR